MKKRYGLMLIILVLSSLYAIKPQKTHSFKPFFTLVALTETGNEDVDYLNLLKHQLRRIGIDLDVLVLTWPTMLGIVLPPWHTYVGLRYVSLKGLSYDPDYSILYSENGTLNFSGYHTSMDWDEELGTGKNEWYLKTGREISPFHSEEKINHYWEWQDYLMREILPIQPLLVPSNYALIWDNLNGYNISDGVIQSWGKMYYSGAHTGQTSLDEIVVADNAWENLNPLLQNDSASDFVSSTCLDPLLWYDKDSSLWLHLAESVEIINEAKVRITCREGIKWQDDPDGLFTNEYFDADDVYFTLYCWKYLSNSKSSFNWMEEITKIDQFTIELTTNYSANQPSNYKFTQTDMINRITKKIIPEHYLNQTQQIDGITPDTSHLSWEKFASHCFGTGLFEINEIKEGTETILTVRSESWWLNSTITNDPLLDWTRRFGDFSGGINQLRIRMIPYEILRYKEFEAGKIDLLKVPELKVDYRDCCFIEPEFYIQREMKPYIRYLAFNLRNRYSIIGSILPCPNDPSLTIGFALRKAICYAIDKQEMNEIIHGSEYYISKYPIIENSGIWCNPNIIQYNHDLDKAWEFMEKAGYTNPFATSSIGFRYTDFVIITSIILLCVVIYPKRKRRMTDGEKNG